MNQKNFAPFSRACLAVLVCMSTLLILACNLTPAGTATGEGVSLDGLESDKGRVVIDLSGSRSFLARDTISPSASQIDGYRISATGGTGGPAPTLYNGGTVRLDLNPGTWTITVEALSAASALISRGSSTVTVAAGAGIQVSISLLPAAQTGGTGNIHLDISWPSATAISSGTASYIPPGGSVATTVNLDMSQAASGRSGFDLTACASGSYVFTLTLLSGSDQAFQPRVTVVQVVDGLTTSGTLAFTASESQHPAVSGSILDMAGNTDSSFLIRGDGTLWAWGDNTEGTLGDGNSGTKVWGPKQIGSDTDWKSISSADANVPYSHTHAIKNDGTLWAWGKNAGYVLGLGDEATRTSPEQVGTDNTWKKIQSATGYVIALKTDGTLWNWGTSPYYPLNGIDYSPVDSPLQLGSDTDWIDLSAVEDHVLALKADGTLWAWGDNSLGQLGFDDSSSESFPRQVGTGTSWAKVVAFAWSSAAIQSDGSLWVWGSNDQGYLGLGDTTNTVIQTPTRLGTATWKNLVRNNAQFLALNTDGSLWTWGWYDVLGRLGTTAASVCQNLPVALGSGKDWDQLFGAGYYLLATKTDGSLWLTGDADSVFTTIYAFPQSATLSNIPLQVGTRQGWKAVATGSGHSLAIDQDDKLWSWGDNSAGQLGTNTDNLSHSYPLCVEPASTWKAVTAGNAFSLGIKTDGTLWAWGDNYFGQLGQGNTASVSLPVQVGTDTDWKKVSAGGYHTLALKTDGSLWAWGSGGSGRLGLGSTSSQTVPTRVGTDMDWTDIAAGDAFSLGLKAGSGTLWAWGYNNYGQLGMGMTTALTVPTKVGSGTFWSGISAGGYHTLATRTDGTLWSWGYNANGQLGIGNNTNKTSPVQVGSLTTWVKPLAAGNSSFGLRSGTTPFSAWGANNYGQLGLGTTTTLGLTSPVDGTISDLVDISAQSLHCLGIRSDGTLWTWGNNDNGQLGQGRNPTVWKQVVLP